jgi:hypothetical protein
MSRKETDNFFNVYLEVGNRRTIAAALDWPGWCRLGRDEDSALQALFEYGPRYAQMVRSARLGYQAPTTLSAFVIKERLKGNGTTDYGVPGLAPAIDSQPPDETELRRLETILKACWRAFDDTIEMAHGKALRTGPRGGGRTLEKITDHVFESEKGYLSNLGGKVVTPENSTTSLDLTRKTILQTLQESADGKLPTHGPRGGKRWSARYFVRRDAWHILDHAWEVEDRLQGSAEKQEV